MPFAPNVLRSTLQGTNISPKNGILKMIFLFPRWDMLIPWRVLLMFQTSGDFQAFLRRFQNSVVNSNRAAYCTNTTMQLALKTQCLHGFFVEKNGVPSQIISFDVLAQLGSFYHLIIDPSTIIVSSLTLVT